MTLPLAIFYSTAWQSTLEYLETAPEPQVIDRPQTVSLTLRK